MKLLLQPHLLSVALLAALVAPQPGLACGEGIYAMTQGSRHQGYLAPHLATVLIYNDQQTVPAATKSVYRALVQAGHTVEVARTPQQLATSLREHRFDVVIVDYDQVRLVDEQLTPASETELLPIVTSEQRSANGWRDRFRFLLDERPSLAQYLKQINQLVKDRA